MRRPVNADRIRAFMGALGAAARGEHMVYLVGGATAVLEGWRDSTVDIDVAFPDGHVPDELLRALPGIGEWTAQYIAMRALAWPDAFPHTDFGVKKALCETDARRVLVAGEAWRPWRAYAVMHLWQSLVKE